VGAILAKDNHTGRTFMRDVVPGRAAASAGIVNGDELLRIEGKSVVTMTPEEVSRRLRGEVGSKVHLTVIHEGVTQEVTVERGPLDEP
jgi:carboxyl-terminal processing protease